MKSFLIVIVFILCALSFWGGSVHSTKVASEKEARNVENLKKGIADDIAAIARAQTEQEKLDEHNVPYRYGPGGLANTYKEHLAGALGVSKEFFKEYTIMRPLLFEEKEILYQEEDGQYSTFDLRNQ